MGSGEKIEFFLVNFDHGFVPHAGGSESGERFLGNGGVRVRFCPKSSGCDAEQWDLSDLGQCVDPDGGHITLREQALGIRNSLGFLA